MFIFRIGSWFLIDAPVDHANGVKEHQAALVSLLERMAAIGSHQEAAGRQRCGIGV